MIRVTTPKELAAALRGVHHEDIQLAHGIFDFGNEECKFRDVDGLNVRPEPGATAVIVSAGLSFKNAANVQCSHLHVYNRDPKQPRSERSRCVSIEADSCRSISIKQSALFWATDQNISVWGDYSREEPNTFGFRNCLIAGGRKRSSHSEGDRAQGHSMGAIVGNRGIHTYFQECIFAYNDDRNPRFQGDVSGTVKNCYVVHAPIKGITLVRNSSGSPSVDIRSATKVTRLTKTSGDLPALSQQAPTMIFAEVLKRVGPRNPQAQVARLVETLQAGTPWANDPMTNGLSLPSLAAPEPTAVELLEKALKLLKGEA